MKHIPGYIKYLLSVSLISLLVMSIFRLALYFIVINNWQVDTSYPFSELLQAFFMGFRFDAVVTAFIMMPPLAILGLSSFFGKEFKIVYRTLLVYFIVVYAAAMIILCSDIPYFLQFYARLNSASLLWIDDSKYMFEMILSDWFFLFFFVLSIILIGVMSIVHIRLNKMYSRQPAFERFTIKSFSIKLGFFLLFALIIILSARGRLSGKSPIRIGTAYFSTNQTLNKIAQNPIYTFGFSVLKDMKSQKSIELMDEDEAVKLSADYLSIAVIDSTLIRTREAWENENGASVLKKNLVIVIMESMGDYKMGRYGGPSNLTPHLKDIASKSIYFDNIYTAGIHTFNGVYSTLFSLPAVYKKQAMEVLMDVPHNGIAKVLREQNYTSSYFSTHDPQFDNVSGFLKANYFQNIYSEYPEEWNLSNNGVPDHIMFETAIPILTDLSNTGNPFLSVFMTSSDHQPFIIPEGVGFQPTTADISQQITEYADWSIGRFLELAAEQDWYNNTIFVFIADHGLNKGNTYDMALSYHSTPLIIFSPFSEVSDTLHCLGGQIDLAPTVLGLMNIPYQNETMGVDLLKKHRPFMYFCADNKVGCLDKDFYLIIRPDGKETLFKYKNLSSEDHYGFYNEKVDSMKQYTYSMMQTTQKIQRLNLKKKK